MAEEIVDISVEKRNVGSKIVVCSALLVNLSVSSLFLPSPSKGEKSVMFVGTEDVAVAVSWTWSWSHLLSLTWAAQSLASPRVSTN